MWQLADPWSEAVALDAAASNIREIAISLAASEGTDQTTVAMELLMTAHLKIMSTEIKNLHVCLGSEKNRLATSCEENARLREALFRANLALNKFEVQGDEEEKDGGGGREGEGQGGGGGGSLRQRVSANSDGQRCGHGSSEGRCPSSCRQPGPASDFLVAGGSLGI